MSLVAIKEEKIVGHILYTTAVIESKRKQIKGMGLAPIATLPEYQNKGVGSNLINAGLERMKKNLVKLDS